MEEISRMFAIQGRLPQFDYATKAIDLYGSPSVVLQRKAQTYEEKSPNSCILFCSLKIAPLASKEGYQDHSDFVDYESITNIYRLNKYGLSCLCIGTQAEVRERINFLRQTAQDHFTLYGNPISPKLLASKTGAYLQGKGQNARLRPAACISIIAGQDYSTVWSRNRIKNEAEKDKQLLEESEIGKGNNSYDDGHENKGKTKESDNFKEQALSPGKVSKDDNQDKKEIGEYFNDEYYLTRSPFQMYRVDPTGYTYPIELDVLGKLGNNPIDENTINEKIRNFYHPEDGLNEGDQDRKFAQNKRLKKPNNPQDFLGNHTQELLFGLRLLHDSLTSEMKELAPFPSFQYEIGILTKGMKQIRLLTSEEVDLLLSMT